MALKIKQTFFNLIFRNLRQSVIWTLLHGNKFCRLAQVFLDNWRKSKSYFITGKWDTNADWRQVRQFGHRNFAFTS